MTRDVWTYSGTCPKCGYEIKAELPTLEAEAQPTLDVERLTRALEIAGADRHGGQLDSLAEDVAAEYARFTRPPVVP